MPCENKANIKGTSDVYNSIREHCRLKGDLRSGYQELQYLHYSKYLVSHFKSHKKNLRLLQMADFLSVINTIIHSLLS